jgi:hypothetical protein
MKKRPDDRSVALVGRGFRLQVANNKMFRSKIIGSQVVCAMKDDSTMISAVQPDADLNVLMIGGSVMVNDAPASQAAVSRWRSVPRKPLVAKRYWKRRLGRSDYWCQRRCDPADPFVWRRRQAETYHKCPCLSQPFIVPPTPVGPNVGRQESGVLKPGFVREDCPTLVQQFVDFLIRSVWMRQKAIPDPNFMGRHHRPSR